MRTTVLPTADYYETKGGASDRPIGFLQHVLGRKGPSGYGSTTTAEQVVAGWSGEVSGSPKVIIITGAGTGLGLESAAVLASKGAEVIIAVRSKQKGEAAVKFVKKCKPDAKATVMLLDLSSFKSVREFAAEFKASGKPLHVLMLNAGVMFCPFQLSADGHEMQFATNHLGHFLLTQLLLDVMLDTAAKCGILGRIISLSSMGHQLYRYPGDVRFDQLDSPEGYDPEKAYGQSKLCNILLARQLNVQLKGKPIVATACHPGIIAQTDLKRHMAKSFPRFVVKLVDMGALNFACKNVSKGAATQVYLATADGVEGGEYYVDCNLASSSIPSHSKQLAQKLWEVSEQLCKE